MSIACSKRNNKINNSGFSLVELIVVISIMAIVTGALTYSLSLMFSRNAESTARQIDDSLSEVRMLSMAKEGRFVMRILMDAEGNAERIAIYKDDTEDKSVRLEKKAVVSCSGDYSSSGGSNIEIEFDKASGNVVYVGAVRASGSTVTGASGVYEIVVEAKNKTKTVTLVAGTGRHFVNK